MDGSGGWRSWDGRAGVIAFGVLAAALMVSLVVLSVRREAPPAFAPTPLEARPAGGALVGPRLFTVEATDGERWVFFSFEQGTVVDRPGPLDWDLAFRRFQVIVNGGPSFAGAGGAVDLGEVSFDEVDAVPPDGYVANTVRSDTVNTVLRGWYDYSFFSHLLSPTPRTFAVRTADGRYAKLAFVGYYCPGAVPGCVTFRYVFQGAGGVALAASEAPGAQL